MKPNHLSFIQSQTHLIDQSLQRTKRDIQKQSAFKNVTQDYLKIDDYSDQWFKQMEISEKNHKSKQWFKQMDHKEKKNPYLDSEIKKNTFISNSSKILKTEPEQSFQQNDGFFANEPFIDYSIKVKEKRIAHKNIISDKKHEEYDKNNEIYNIKYYNDMNSQVQKSEQILFYENDIVQKELDDEFYNDLMEAELEFKEHNYQRIKNRRLRLKKFDHSSYKSDRLFYWTLMIIFIHKLQKKARKSKISRRILFYECIQVQLAQGFQIGNKWGFTCVENVLKFILEPQNENIKLDFNRTGTREREKLESVFYCKQLLETLLIDILNAFHILDDQLLSLLGSMSLNHSFLPQNLFTSFELQRIQVDLETGCIIEMNESKSQMIMVMILIIRMIILNNLTNTDVIHKYVSPTFYRYPLIMTNLQMLASLIQCLFLKYFFSKVPILSAEQIKLQSDESSNKFIIYPCIQPLPNLAIQPDALSDLVIRPFDKQVSDIDQFTFVQGFKPFYQLKKLFKEDIQWSKRISKYVQNIPLKLHTLVKNKYSRFQHFKQMYEQLKRNQNK